MKIVSAGEVLWDVFDHSEILGGAPFNFAYHAARLGHEAIFVSAVGDDERGSAILTRASELGMSTDFIQTVAGAATGTVTVRVDAAGQPDFTIHRPAAYDLLNLGPADLERLAVRRPDWLYYGTLYQGQEIRKMANALPDSKRFYDINLRRDSFTKEIVGERMAMSHVVKLNDDEAGVIDAMFGTQHESLEEFTRFWSEKFGWRAVAVTRGSRGCAIRMGADYAEVAGTRVQVADTVGAGDAFAAGFLHKLSQGWNVGKTGEFANRVGALVASRAGGTPEWTPAEL